MRRHHFIDNIVDKAPFLFEGGGSNLSGKFWIRLVEFYQVSTYVLCTKLCRL